MIRKITSISSVALCLMLALSTVFSAVTLAAGSKIYVTPTSGSLQPGQSITIQVKGDLASGTFYGADTVSGSLQFPANLLKVTSASTSGATFNWQATATPGNGVVNFNERAFFGTDNTSVFIMSVTFQALAAGTANIGFSGTTSFSSSQFGVNIPTSLSGGSYAISNPTPTTCPAGQIGTPPNCTTPPPATCPAGQVGTPPNCTTPTPAKCPTGQTGTPPNCKTPSSTPSSSGTSTPSTPAVPVAQTPTEPIPEPTDNGLSISDASTTRSYKTASLNWKTSSPAKNTVTYGTSLKQLDKTAEVTQEADGSYTAKLTDLGPGKRYYFTISAASEKDATKTSTYSGVFTTKGFPVMVTVTEGGQAASNAKLKISEQTYSTDKSGKINFELASGSYTVEVTTSKGSKNFTLAVAEKAIPDDGKAPDTQNFIFDVPVTETTSNSSLSPLTLIGIGVGALAGLALLVGLFILWRRRRSQQTAATSTIDNDYTWAAQQPLPAFPQEQPTSMQEQPGMDMTAMPMDMPYAAPPTDIAPPQEIMPPDQAVAMAIPELPPAQENEFPGTIVETMQPTSDGTMPMDTQLTPLQPYTETPEINTPPSQPIEETAPVEQFAPAEPQNGATEMMQPQSEQPPEDSNQTVEPLPDTTPPSLQMDEDTTDIPSDEPGLNDAPPTTESGRGELQIEHDHSEPEADTTDEQTSAKPVLQ